MVNLYEKHRWHLDPNRPPMTTPEVVTLSQTIGGLKRGKNTIANALQTLSLQSLSTVVDCLEQAIDLFESARNYAKAGK